MAYIGNSLVIGTVMIWSGTRWVATSLKYQIVQGNGTPATARSNLNFISGTNATVSVADDVSNNRTNVTLSATPAGATTQVQLNTSGAFGASANLTFDPVLRKLTVGGASAIVSLPGAGSQVLIEGQVSLQATGLFGSGGDFQFNTAGGNLYIGSSGGFLLWPTVAPDATSGRFLRSGSPTASNLIWSQAYDVVQSGGTAVAQRGKLNFVAGSNITVSAVDDSVNGRTNVTFSVAGGAGLPGGAAGQIQFNVGGTSFGGDAALAWNSTGTTRQIVMQASSSTGTTGLQFLDSTGSQIGLASTTSDTRFDLKRLGVSANLFINDVQWPSAAPSAAGNFLVAASATSAQWTTTPKLNEQTTAPGAVTGGVALYTKPLGGRDFPAWVEPTNLASMVQEFLGGASIGVWKPPGNATTAPGVFGMPALTAVGTATARTVATTNAYTRMKRLGYVSAAAINSAASARAGTAQITVGTGSGLGGFFKVIRFGNSDAVLVTDATMFVGVGTASAIAGGVSPATLINCFGVGRRSTDTNMQLFYGGGAAQTPIDLGASFPSNTLTDFYELAIFSPPSSNTVIYYQLTNLLSGATTGVQSVTGVAGTAIPGSTILMSQTQVYRSTVAGTAAVGIDLISDYTWSNN